MKNADAIDVVIVVCPRCRGSGSSGVIGRVVRNHRGRHRFVTVVTARGTGERAFSDDQLLQSADFVVFDFDGSAGGRDSIDVACKHGRRSVPPSRLEREIASHREGKPARILISEPPAH